MSFLRYWAGLFASDDQDMIRAGVQMVMKISNDMLKKSQEIQAPRRLMGGGDETDAGAITDLEERQQSPLDPMPKLEDDDGAITAVALLCVVVLFSVLAACSLCRGIYLYFVALVFVLKQKKAGGCVGRRWFMSQVTVFVGSL
jgi:hypothetical protein